MLTRSQSIASWALQLTVAVILFQTLFFKFTAAEESVYIFSTLGQMVGLPFAEPWGRIGSGVLELAAVALILYPPTVAIGALLSLGVITGALASHALIGVVVKDDGGLLFGLAVTVFLASLAILYIRRNELPVLGARLFRSVA
jgi:hypothetical protein